MLTKTRAVAQWFITQGFDQSKPLMILSSNSVNQAVITYGTPTSMVFSTLRATEATDQVETHFEAITLI